MSVSSSGSAAYSGSLEGSNAQRGLWSSRLAFILAATGSAVGLGNIWKFPYVTGENGGGAFVLVYLLCIAIIGIPIMMAEVMIGRRGGHSPVNSIKAIAQRDGLNPAWKLVGAVGILAGFLILSFYSVIGGWAISYVGTTASGQLSGQTADAVGAIFSGLLSNPGTLLLWHTVFMALVMLVVAKGVRSGLERAVSILMPALFVLLLIVVGYAMTTGHFGQAAAFLFQPDFSKLTTSGVLVALGHAFFTLSLGMAVMMAYGSYLPKKISIAKTSITVSVIDTGVALLAGLAIFPIVFANGLEPGAGPGLIFQTLPLAFGQMPMGSLFGTLFFVLLIFAAWTSGISLLEPIVEWLEEQKGMNRTVSTLGAGVVCWALGIASILSLNLWADFAPLGFIPMLEGKTIFDLLDFFTANILLPLGGLLVALMAGWVMSKPAMEKELALSPGTFNLWFVTVRFITPIAVGVVFIYNLM
ncbi:MULTISPECIES: sodium-dependent transporter [Marinobacter]|mgnify:FL=1|jgi:NSS family neurotransmitter:Na+ symporter|uniref:Transporter n=1 Tax=Marinobacter nauticus TaxID=2743 RepID=A0A368XY07_MARNT|nr:MULTISPECIES: sodium-dependent transporter [Marinobacter]MAP30977.1 sodium-dependent transporter [Marinobacter sp.]MEC8897700.1 sodium-dependent transporter [Pseudomonadota bacterium]ERS84517.1 transporter [Marinobacter sp. EVN1]ERS89837.1 transporter [Marinobacter sp. C1S70]MBW3197341.1 sodium-dependent transporter [Marinobacter nauticus]|tara:strand:+ start:883 stop:2295 length:1413 start_codon:yes stop_codon:yes gene_type:complete